MHTQLKRITSNAADAVTDDHIREAGAIGKRKISDASDLLLIFYAMVTFVEAGAGAS